MYHSALAYIVRCNGCYVNMQASCLANQIPVENLEHYFLVSVDSLAHGPVTLGSYHVMFCSMAIITLIESISQNFLEDLFFPGFV